LAAATSGRRKFRPSSFFASGAARAGQHALTPPAAVRRPASAHEKKVFLVRLRPSFHRSSDTAVRTER
jgi:hypothetical protein